MGWEKPFLAVYWQLSPGKAMIAVLTKTVEPFVLRLVLRVVRFNDLFFSVRMPIYRTDFRRFC